MKASESLIQKLKEFEGLRLQAYRDAAGVPTIGYGHTRHVKMGDRLTAYWADQLLRDDVRRVVHDVMQLGVVHTQGSWMRSRLSPLTWVSANSSVRRC